VEGTFSRPAKAVAIKTAGEAYLKLLRTEAKAKRTLQKVELVVRRVEELSQRKRVTLLSSLGLSFLDAYRAERVEAGAMPRTVLNETVIIRQLVNFAVARNLLNRDPLAGLKIKKVKSRSNLVGPSAKSLKSWR